MSGWCLCVDPANLQSLSVPFVCFRLWSLNDEGEKLCLCFLHMKPALLLLRHTATTLYLALSFHYANCHHTHVMILHEVNVIAHFEFCTSRIL